MNTTVRYDRAILKDAIAAYIKRVYFRHMILPTVLGFALLTYASSGAPPWLQAFIVVTVLLIPTVTLLGYWMRVRHSLKILDMLQDGTVSFSISDDGFTTKSAIGNSSLAWKVFSEIWDTPKSHLLLYTNHQFITLPKDQVSPDFIHELQRKIHSEQGAAANP